MPNHRVFPFQPDSEFRYIISSLKTSENEYGEESFYKFAPHRLFTTKSDAVEAARKYLKIGTPMYVLEVVCSIEITPPPATITNF